MTEKDALCTGPHQSPDRVGARAVRSAALGALKSVDVLLEGFFGEREGRRYANQDPFQGTIVERGGHEALDFGVGLQRLVGDPRHMTPGHRHRFRLHQVVEFFVESEAKGGLGWRATVGVSA